jgi:hypothetical protein
MPPFGRRPERRARSQDDQPPPGEPQHVEVLETLNQAARKTLRKELEKLAINCRYRAECQITAAGFWGNFQLLVGALAAIFAGAAGASAFAKHSVVAGALAVAASVLSAVLATVKAGERAATHEHSGNELNLLAEETFRLHELSGDGDVGATDDLAKAFQAAVLKRDEHARKAPFVNRRLCRKATTFLARGESYYSADPRKSGRQGFLRRRLFRRRSTGSP